MVSTLHPFFPKTESKFQNTFRLKQLKMSKFHQPRDDVTEERLLLSCPGDINSSVSGTNKVKPKQKPSGRRTASECVWHWEQSPRVFPSRWFQQQITEIGYFPVMTLVQQEDFKFTRKRFQFTVIQCEGEMPFLSIVIESKEAGSSSLNKFYFISISLPYFSWIAMESINMWLKFTEINNF